MAEVILSYGVLHGSNLRLELLALFLFCFQVFLEARAFLTQVVHRLVPECFTRLCLLISLLDERLQSFSPLRRYLEIVSNLVNYLLFFQL